MWTGAFRDDIQGIRAVAIVIALLAHAGFPFATGGYVGVDMFFVLSGFLITGLLVTELEGTGKIRLGKFYARRVKRLVPLAILVLAATVLATQLLFSPVRSQMISGDVIAAAAHFVNWRFSVQAVDYFAPDTVVSPVQHYWSLSVEEQFYLLWPALLLAATLWLRRSGRSIRPALWVAVAVPGILSLGYSVWYTGQSPDPAYFSTLTRVWELALGAALALMPRPSMSRPVAAALTYAGLGAVVFATVTYDGTTAFPGLAALVPTLGVAAIVIAGSNARGLSVPGRVLASRPFCHVGDISYGLYLWHWPALIFAAEIWGPLSLWQGVAAVAVAWTLTEVSHRLVEQPFRYASYFSIRPRRGLVLWAGGAATAIGAALVLVWAQPSIPTAPASAVAGAAILDDDRPIERRATSIHPNPLRLGDDRGRLPEDGCFLPKGESEHPECAYGDPSSEATVILFGDSKANQHFPALEFLARKHGWRLVGLVKAGCSPVPAVARDDDCRAWREAALERIDSEQPVLIAVGSNYWPGLAEAGRRIDGRPASEVVTESFTAMLSRLRESGARVAVVKDLPRAPFDVPECVSESLDDLEQCWFPVPDHHHDTYADRAAEAVGGAQLVDLTPAVCPAGTCRGVIGRALVYRDHGHITATFAETLAPRIERQLPRIR